MIIIIIPIFCISYIVPILNYILKKLYICFRKDYTCHHSNFRKVEAAQNKRGKSKNINCPAKIKIIVKKTTVDTLKKDKFIKVRLF